MKRVFIIRNTFVGNTQKPGQIRYRTLEVPKEYEADGPSADAWYMREIDHTSELITAVWFENWGGAWVKPGDTEYHLVNGEIKDTNKNPCLDIPSPELCPSTHRKGIIKIVPSEGSHFHLEVLTEGTVREFAELVLKELPVSGDIFLTYDAKEDFYYCSFQCGKLDIRARYYKVWSLFVNDGALYPRELWTGVPHYERYEIINRLKMEIKNASVPV